MQTLDNNGDTSDTLRRFASLHNHTYYSLLDAVMSPAELVQQAYDLGYKAVAITEHGNAHSFVEGYKKAQELGMKLIVGCEVYETDDMDYKEPDANRFHLILLAKSNKGMENLFKIISEGHTRGFYTKPRVDLKLMAQYSEDIICMSSCLGGRINRIMGTTPVTEDTLSFAKQWVAKYKEVFGDNFYLEMQSHNTMAQNIANRNLLLLAKETNTEFTITFDTHIRDGSELQQDVHRKFIKISQDREVGETYEGCWQQTMEEVHACMDRQIHATNVEKAIDTTEKIADQCDITIELHQDLMPHIHIPEEFATEVDYLKHLVKVGWKRRRFETMPKAKRKEYAKRLEDEMEVLEYLGYVSYFIMLYQLINKFKERGIPLGYSRGSGGNCLTLYTIGVTEVDSIKWNLDFSRFANKGRKGSMADYDIDISQFRRQEALEVAIELFGEENVAQLATFNSLSPKVCIRDLGKVFDEEKIYEIPYSIRDKISKLIPDDANQKMTIERALESSSELQKWAEKFPLLFEYTKYLQNLPKSVGCHAAAVIIAPKPAVEFAPLMLNKQGNVMLQLEMHNAMDDLGLIKMDFLGLVTVDVVDVTLKLANLSWDDINLATMDLDDQEVFQNIYGKGKTLGVFQMETFTPQRMFRDMMPNININDVFAVNAMNRPAVLSVGMDRTYIHNKHNPEDVKYLHPSLEQVFGETNGIMLYQEQALKVFRLAGFPLDETDTARRAIGKKKADVMAQLYGKFKDGLVGQGWTEEQVETLWKLVEAQSGYSFNAGHSTAYGLLSYVTAYLKYHYPVEFMTALLISEIGNYQQLTKYIQECREMNIEVMPPDINMSGEVFTIDKGRILFGLLSIKGVGKSAVETILEERNKNVFRDFTDFYGRCASIGSTAIVSLIQSGAFGFEKDRILMHYCELVFDRKEFKPVKTLPTKKKLLELGIIRSEIEYKNKEILLERYNDYKKQEHDKKQTNKWLKHSQEFQLKYMMSPDMYEYNTLSIFLQGHPLDGLESFFPQIGDYEEGAKVLIGGTISNVKYKKQKNGMRMADIEVLTLLDGIIECRCFASTYTTYQDLIKKGENVIILAKKNGNQCLVDKMRNLDDWRKKVLEKRRSEQSGEQ